MNNIFIIGIFFIFEKIILRGKVQATHFNEARVKSNPSTAAAGSPTAVQQLSLYPHLVPVGNLLQGNVQGFFFFRNIPI